LSKKSFEFLSTAWLLVNIKLAATYMYVTLSSDYTSVY